jgi:hypothetical protein
MKAFFKILLGLLLLSGVEFVLSGCVAEGGYVGGGGGVYYGPENNLWFHDDLWIDGHRRGYWNRPDIGGRGYIHPPRVRGSGPSRGPSRGPGPSHNPGSGPRPGPSGHNPGSDHR